MHFHLHVLSYVILRRAFKTKVVIHNPLKGTIASWLFQEYCVITLHKPVSQYVHRVQHVNPVDSVPCDRVVSPDESGGK